MIAIAESPSNGCLPGDSPPPWQCRSR
jgi:hypothetical protein